MATITLYKLDPAFSNTPTGWYFEEPDVADSERYRLNDPVAYDLPTGYWLGESQVGEPTIYATQDGRETDCTIIQHSSGRPQLVSGFGWPSPVLKVSSGPTPVDGAFLLSLRKGLSLTQEQMGEVFGRSRVQYSQYERDQVEMPPELRRLARYIERHGLED